ncbi:hypothetical protein [Nocardia sp. IFM 10818]
MLVVADWVGSAVLVAHNLVMLGWVRVTSKQRARVGRWWWLVLLSAGFGVAVLSGVKTSFSQPLATLLAGTGVLAAGTLVYATHERTRVGGWWVPLTLLVVGGGAGFGAAVLSGVKTSFSQPLATVLAGTGVLAAGVIAYVNGQRTRDQAEEHHNEDTERAREAALWQRFGAAATQLADKSAAIRIAGVYAMVASPMSPRPTANSASTSCAGTCACPTTRPRADPAAPSW